MPKPESVAELVGGEAQSDRPVQPGVDTCAQPGPVAAQSWGKDEHESLVAGQIDSGVRRGSLRLSRPRGEVAGRVVRGKREPAEDVADQVDLPIRDLLVVRTGRVWVGEDRAANGVGAPGLGLVVREVEQENRDR